MQPFKAFHALLNLICLEMKGMKALSTKTGMSIQKNGVEAHFTSNLVFINLVPINDTQIKGLRVVLQISILANKAGRTTLTISGIDNFHK